MTDTMIASPAVMETLPDFMEMILRHVGPKNAAVACGWTLRQLAELERLPQFQEMMAAAQDRRIESVEQVAYELAEKGNVPMIQMILYCQAADKGWRPPTQRVSHHVQGTVAIEKVEATKEALRQIMLENGVKMLASGGPLDEIEDAEIVEG